MAGRLPESYIAPAHLLDLRARVRLRHSLVDQRGEWQQRTHAVLYHHGHPQKDGLLRVANRAWLEQIALPDAAREQVTVALAMIDALKPRRPSPPSCAATRAANRAARRCWAFTASASSPRLRSSPTLATRAGSLRLAKRSATPAWTSRSISPTGAAAPAPLPPRTARAALGALRSRAGRAPARQPRPRLLRPGRPTARRQPRLPRVSAQVAQAQLPHLARARRRSARPRLTGLGGRCARSPLLHRCPAAGSPHAAAATCEWPASKDRAAAPHHAGTPHQPSRHRPRQRGRGPR